MPPRRRQVKGGQEESAPASGRQFIRHRPSPMDVIPRVEKLREERTHERRQILEKHEEYIERKMEKIQNHYASEAKRRSAKAKDLLARYAEAIQERQEIEKAIEKIVTDLRDNLLDLAKILGAAYSGRREQAHNCIGSFASIVPPAADDNDMTPKSDSKTGAKTTSKGDAQFHNGEGNKGSSGDKDTIGYKKEQEVDIFSQLSW